jgi:hypothetical protein
MTKYSETENELFKAKNLIVQGDNISLFKKGFVSVFSKSKEKKTFPNAVKEGKFINIELPQGLQKQNVENEDKMPKKKKKFRQIKEVLKFKIEKTSDISYIQNLLDRLKSWGKANPKKNNQMLEVDKTIKIDHGNKYNFSNLNRGKALIFNHVKFAKHQYEKASDLIGSENNVEYLRLVLKAIGFDVEVFIDLSIDQVKTELKNYSKTDFSDSDCFLLVAMSHGMGDRLRTYDKSLPVDTYWKTISKNKTLKGKPKLFIFDMCREKSSPQSLQIPDLLVSYSTSPGLRSFSRERHKISSTDEKEDLLYYYEETNEAVNPGSPYIEALCETIAREYSNRDLESIIQQNGETLLGYIPSWLTFKQIPTHNSTLTKKIYVNDDKVNTDLIAECCKNLKKARRTGYTKESLCKNICEKFMPSA